MAVLPKKTIGVSPFLRLIGKEKSAVEKACRPFPQLLGDEGVVPLCRADVRVRQQFADGGDVSPLAKEKCFPTLLCLSPRSVREDEFHQTSSQIIHISVCVKWRS